MAKIRMEDTHYSLITDGVKENEQTLDAVKPFWVFFVANLGFSYWLVGVLIANMGLNFADGLFALLLGSMIGSALPAALAIIGPKTRLSQVEAGRLSLGRTGKKFPAFLNWIGCIGWDVASNVPSTIALVSLLGILGVIVPFWLALGVLVGIQLLIGIYGHHLIQNISKYTGTFTGVLFVIIGLIAIHKTGIAPQIDKIASPKAVFSAIALLVACNISWVPYATDYTRYLPKNTPSRTVFLGVFVGLFLSLFILTFFGFVTASTVVEQTPEGVMAALQGLAGRFAPLVFLLIAFNSISTNAVNDNSAAYSLMSAGIKLPRHVVAIVGAVVGYVVCLMASHSFIDFFENLLFLFAHWMTPWAAIVLVHWFVVHKVERRTPSGITMGCVILVCVSALSIALFSANSVYTGILSDAVGGVDIGPYIGFVVAGALYYAAFRLFPQKFTVLRTSLRAQDTPTSLN